MDIKLRENFQEVNIVGKKTKAENLFWDWIPPISVIFLFASSPLYPFKQS